MEGKSGVESGLSYRKRLVQPGRLETPVVASVVVFIDAGNAQRLAVPCGNS
jgi:hypothetical protein